MLGVAVLAATAAAAFPQAPPNDPLYDQSPLPNATNEQWDLSSDRGISVDRAWPLSTGQGITIADVDVGVQLDHPDLRNQWAPGAHDFYDGDDDPTSPTRNEHGTNVAGVLAAQADNGIGVAGIAPGAKLLALRTSDNILHQGNRLASAIRYAADHGATVISMSLGADTFPRALREAVRYAHDKGVVMAVASGNEFHFHHHYPQVMSEVMAVGGINPDTANVAARDQNLALTATDFTIHAAYADYGPHLDVVAPTQVPTTSWGGGYRMTWDGTSAATPHVAGVAALIQARAKQLGVKLSADQVIQLIRTTADDLGPPGWDPKFGYGRVNAFKAVSAVANAPPGGRITEPQIYAPVDKPFDVRADIQRSSWKLELGQGQTPSAWRTLATGRGEGKRKLARVDPRTLAAGGWTLRLTLDGRGQDRSFFTVERDPELRVLRALDTSGEASPQLADVRNGRRPEIVLATSDGEIDVLDGRTLKNVRGWPRHALAGRGGLRSSFLGTPAVGDVFGDRKPEVVAADLDGRFYAWTAKGKLLKGFPRRIALVRPGTDELGSKLDSAIYASPALADLNGDGKLDIVAGAADQRIYAIDGRGRDLPGWPVTARGTDVAKILSSPAIGDLDGDHRPDVVEGTAEAYGSTPQMSGRVYAFDHAGRPLPGWPISPPGIVTDGIPMAGEGVPMSPVLADVDGDGRDEVAIAAFTGTHELYNGDGTRRFAFSSDGTLALGANAAFAKTGGRLRLFGGVVDDKLIAAQLSPASDIPFDHLADAWDAETGDKLDGYPRTMEGWMLAGAPAVGDVSGDGKPEVLQGSSGDVLHAVDPETGKEPAGWPKDTGGWLLATPAIGDVDGDGRNEVIAVTRDGFLYVYDTPGRAGREWPVFRHDARNSGRYG